MKNDMALWRYFFLILVFMLLATPASAQIYKYRDQNGQLHFTNELSEIPEDQQPQVIIKQPEQPVKPQETKANAPGGDPSETKEATDPSSEIPKAEKDNKPRQIPLVEDLNKEKATLDKTHAKLMKRKQALKKERETLKTPDQVREYRKKVTRLNNEIDAYKKRNKAFQKKADAYNKALREKGEE